MHGFLKQASEQCSSATAHLPSQMLRWKSLKTMLGQCCMLLAVRRISSGHSQTIPDTLLLSEKRALEACVRPCRFIHRNTRQHAGLHPSSVSCGACVACRCSVASAGIFLLFVYAASAVDVNAFGLCAPCPGLLQCSTAVCCTPAAMCSTVDQVPGPQHL